MKKVFTPTRLILVVLVLGSFAFSNLTTEWFPQWTPKPLELESLEAELSSMCDAILLSEDFQAQAIPAGWTNLDLDMAADVNARPMDFYIFESLANPLADGSPNFVAAASSWFNPPGASNNWLITPPLTICANDFTLSWDSAPFEGPAFMDGYTVQISTTDANPNSFNDVVFTVAEGDNIGNVGPGTPHTNFMGTNGLLQSWEVDLSSYNGSTIYIAFVHQTNDDNLIMFDNIQVARNAQVDVTVANGQPFPAYRTIPFRQLQPLDFTATVNNLGSETANNLFLTTEVDLAGNTVSVASSTLVPSLVSGGFASLLIPNNYTPTDLGNYEVTFTPGFDEIDGNPNNNDLMIDFTVASSTYAKNDGFPTDNLSIGPGFVGFLGQDFELVQNDILTRVDFTVASSTTGDIFRATVFDNSTGNPGASLGVSEVITVSDPNLQNYSLDFPGGLLLPTGRYTIALEEADDQELQLGTTVQNFEPNSSWIFVNGEWSPLEDFNFSITFTLSGEFTCPPPIVDFSVTQQNDMTFIFQDQSTLNPPATFMWDLGDGTTSGLSSFTHTFPFDDVFNVCLTVIDFCGSAQICKQVDASGSVSVEEQTIEQSLQVFPNPTSDQVRLEWANIQEDFRIDLVNVLGQTVRSQLVGATDTDLTMRLDGLQAGVYFVQFVLTDGQVSRKLLIQR